MADEQEETVSETVSVETAEIRDDPFARVEAQLAALNEQIGGYHERIAEHETRLAALEGGVEGYAGREHSHDGYAAGDHSHTEHAAGGGAEAEATRHESAPRPSGGFLSNIWYRPIRRG